MITNDVHILLLEDDEDMRDVLEEVLTDEGYSVTAVGSGECAVERASEGSFQLIIADIRMDGMGGLEAIKQTQELQPQIGSMIVSGFATERETAQAQRLNVGAYLKKPFKTQALLEHVRSILGQESQKQVKSQEDKLFWRAIDWSLESMAQTLDESKMYEGSLVKASEKVEWACSRLNMAPELCAAARRAALILGYCKSKDNEAPDFFLSPNQLLGSLPVILDEAREDSPSVGKDLVVQVVLAILDSELGESSSLQALEQRYSPDVLDIISEANSDSAPQVTSIPSTHSSATSMILLGKTLERVGDLANASKAFDTLCSKSAPREQIEGLLGKARIASKSGELDSCRELNLNVLRLAKKLGPMALSDSGLEAALMLDSIEAKESLKALELVAGSIQGLGLPIRQVVVALALDRLGDRDESVQALGLLSQPVAFDEISRYTAWIFPKLFKQVACGHELFESPLIRLVKDFPGDFLVSFSTAGLSAEIRLKTARALAGSRYLPTPILESFKNAPEPELRELAARFAARVARENPVSLLRLYSFGEMTLINQGEAVDDKGWKTRKVKFLFAHLAQNWGRAISDESLLEIFWPKDQSRTKKNLYWASTALRGLLRKLNPSLQNSVLRENENLTLDVGIPRWHDLEEFRKATEAAKKQEEGGFVNRAREHLRLASRLYRGPYLEGCYYDFAVEERAANEKLALEVYLSGSRLALMAEDNEEALEQATLAAELAPYEQEGHGLKMRAHMRLDQSPAAVDQFHKLESYLKREYDMEPATSLIELYHRARLGFGSS